MARPYGSAFCGVWRLAATAFGRLALALPPAQLRRRRSLRPSCQPALEVEPDLSANAPRRHEVRPAERRKEVIQRLFIRDVDDRESSAHLVLVSVEKIVVADGEIEEVSLRNARRILVIVLAIRRRHGNERRSKL